MIYDELISKFLNDLNNGIIVPKKDKSGNWIREYVPYQEVLKFYCTGTVARNAFLAKYKTLTPISDFPAEEKTEWKKFVNSIFPDKSPEFRLDAVKIIYCIGILSNQ